MFKYVLAHVEGHCNLDPTHQTYGHSLSFHPKSTFPWNISFSRASPCWHKLSPSGMSSFHNILTERPSLPSRCNSDVLPQLPWSLLTQHLNPDIGYPHRMSCAARQLTCLHFCEFFLNLVFLVTNIVPDLREVFVKWMDGWVRQWYRKNLGVATRQHGFYQSYSLISLSNFLLDLTLELTHLLQPELRHHKITGNRKSSSLSADGWCSSQCELEKSDPLRCANKTINSYNNYSIKSSSAHILSLDNRNSAN